MRAKTVTYYTFAMRTSKAKQSKPTHSTATQSKTSKQYEQATQAQQAKQGKAKQAKQAEQTNAKHRIATAKHRKEPKRKATQSQATKTSNHNLSPSLPLSLWGWPGGMRGPIESAHPKE